MVVYTLTFHAVIWSHIDPCCYIINCTTCAITFPIAAERTEYKLKDETIEGVRLISEIIMVNSM